VNLMLAFLVLFTIVGLFSSSFGRRTYWLLGGLSSLMVMLYFVFPNRFIT
jgi:hypothetical protein